VLQVTIRTPSIVKLVIGGESDAKPTDVHPNLLKASITVDNSKIVSQIRPPVTTTAIYWSVGHRLSSVPFAY
jgi:hypothetical protein